MVFPLRVIQLCPYFKKATAVLLHQARSVHAAQPDNRHTHIYTPLLHIHTKSYHDITFVCQIHFSLCKFVTPVVQIKNESMKQEKV